MTARDQIARLPFDVARCHGVGCERKNQCLRYQQLSNMGPRTPIYQNACGFGDSFMRGNENVSE